MYQDAIVSKHPTIGIAWMATDGVNIDFEQAGIDSIQNMFFRGWAHVHYVNSVFVFAQMKKYACA